MSISLQLRLLDLLLLTFIVISLSSLASARPLMADQVKAAITPELNLELSGVLPENNSPDSDGFILKRQNVPCEMSSVNGEVRLLKRFEAGGNFGSLFLSALPKGARVPPSGPSRRTNVLNN